MGNLDLESHDRPYAEAQGAEPSSPYEVIREGQCTTFKEHTDVASQGSDC